MSSSPRYVHFGDLSANRRLGRLTWLALMCLLAWDFSGLDRSTMHLFADSGGFSLRDNGWFEAILHKGAKHIAIVIYLFLWLMIWWPQRVFRELTQAQRVEIVAGIAMCLITVSTLKSFSLTSCPWALQDFGGAARYVSHWRWGLGDGGSGHCFPGGHASSALAFLALPLPWLASGLMAQRRLGKRLVIAVLFLGLLLGLSQTLRGAHYPSHTFWTAFICWSVGLANHMGFGWLAQRKAQLVEGPR